MLHSPELACRSKSSLIDCGSSGDCIKVGTTATSQLGNSCATITPTSIDVTTGEITGYSDLLLGDTYVSAATAARLQRTVGHELAHALGLDHNNCQTSDSLMSAPTVCASGCQFTSVFNACTQSTGLASALPVTDILPTAKSTYGNGVQSVCGF